MLHKALGPEENVAFSPRQLQEGAFAQLVLTPAYVEVEVRRRTGLGRGTALKAPPGVFLLRSGFSILEGLPIKLRERGREDKV